MRAAVVTFPGSNCDRDMRVALARVGADIHTVWYRDTEFPLGTDLVVLPGGFSFGDYLRCGAIAANAPIIAATIKFAKKGGLLLGVCNGFQILVEIGLLPGGFTPNIGSKFICKDAYLRVENSDSPFTNMYRRGQVISIPIAHMDGRYILDGESQKRVEDQGQVAFRYVDSSGNVSDNSNQNGSTASIAGVFSPDKRVLGMMPHPERAADAMLGLTDGTALFQALVGGSAAA